MPLNLDALIQDTLQLNAAHAAIADTAIIKFDETYRKSCAQNRCGQYDTSWMGPPAVGTIPELKEKVLQYKQGLLFQTIYTFQSSGLFDYKAMKVGGEAHLEIFRNIREMMRTKYSPSRLLALNAGCCNLCGRCSYLDKEPCRLPDEAVASLEAYGIDVMALEVAVGIPYYNGKGTYSFAGLLLFEE